VTVTRGEDDLAETIDKIAKAENMDRSTVIRRFLSKAVRSWLIERSLEEYGTGKITLWQAAKRCGISLWEMIDEVKHRATRVPYSVEDLRDDLKGLRLA
jgi:predicted HTH domain antitoxin